MPGHEVAHEWRRPDRRTPSKGLDDAHHRSTAATHTKPAVGVVDSAAAGSTAMACGSSQQRRDEQLAAHRLGAAAVLRLASNP